MPDAQPPFERGRLHGTRRKCAPATPAPIRTSDNHLYVVAGNDQRVQRGNRRCGSAEERETHLLDAEARRPVEVIRPEIDAPLS